MSLLHREQERSGFLGAAALADIARACGTSSAELYGAVSAYPLFRLKAGVPSPSACRQAASQLPHEPSAAPAEPLVPQSVFFRSEDPFEAALQAVRTDAQSLLRILADSGLRGCGGAGFPTARKWQAVRAAGGPEQEKYVVCNADESEPGCFKDRVLLDRQARRILAGMRIAGHVVGARTGVLYIRYEYLAQSVRLLDEIERLRAEGVFGADFDVVVRRGAGLYVCGEETALLNSLEGKRPVPRERPPYPPESGLFGRPTLVQNVETLAAVPAIVSYGAAWYRSTGPAKLYCVSGDVPRPGVYEMAMTASAGELLARAGASPADVKAFTLGGLSGGFLSASRLDVRLDFDDPRRYGAFLGAGGVIVLGRERCPVRFALDGIRFYADESCGKCFPCRIGTTRLRERLEAACRLSAVDAQELKDLVSVLTAGSACGLGPAAALLVEHLTTHFADEVAAHLRGNCPAGECVC